MAYHLRQRTAVVDTVLSEFYQDTYDFSILYILCFVLYESGVQNDINVTPLLLFTVRQHSSMLCRCPVLAVACLSVRPSVHLFAVTLLFYQNEASQDHKIFTVTSAKDFRYGIRKAYPETVRDRAKVTTVLLIDCHQNQRPWMTLNVVPDFIAYTVRLLEPTKEI